MSRFILKSRKIAGSPPGTLVHVGEQKTEQSIISLIQYSPEHIETRILDNLASFDGLPAEPVCSWINIDGIHDLNIIQAVGKQFDIHDLTLEDIVNSGHRPKAEEFDGYVYIVVKMLQFDALQDSVMAEQVSFVLGDRFLLSFQERPGDVFAPVRERLLKAKGRIRQRGCDYLAYTLIDAVVDHYFLILENLGDHIEFLEEKLTENPDRDVMHTIHRLKREVIYLRKQVWPLREVLGALAKGGFDLIGEANHVYMMDVYDHVVQVMDTIESYRDVLSGMLDLYLSTISNRMNEVMKVLTIMATIFIPITFIVGVYGMNFKNMPELEWPWGYGMVWGVMIAIVAAMVVVFRKRGWL